jgi:hypothetical protein
VNPLSSPCLRIREPATSLNSKPREVRKKERRTLSHGAAQPFLSDLIPLISSGLLPSKKIVKKKKTTLDRPVSEGFDALIDSGGEQIKNPD